jgi:hypothetical protein
MDQFYAYEHDEYEHWRPIDPNSRQEIDNRVLLLAANWSSAYGQRFLNLPILTWNHATVPAIARHIYDDRAFYDLPILADALEDAGCTNPDILAHCRAGGEHVRGCWVVDLILGKS